MRLTKIMMDLFSPSNINVSHVYLQRLTLYPIGGLASILCSSPTPAVCSIRTYISPLCRHVLEVMIHYLNDPQFNMHLKWTEQRMFSKTLCSYTAACVANCMLGFQHFNAYTDIIFGD